MMISFHTIESNSYNISLIKARSAIQASLILLGLSQAISSIFNNVFIARLSLFYLLGTLSGIGARTFIRFHSYSFCRHEDRISEWNHTHPYLLTTIILICCALSVFFLKTGIVCVYSLGVMKGYLFSLDHIQI